MTQEEKAKRYDEALHKAKNYYSTTDSSSDIKLIGLIFPELKESEDEKIRKELIKFVKSRGGFKQEYIAWVEKQGEQKPADLPKGEDYGVDGLYAAIDILQKTLGKVDGYQTDDGILEHKCAISDVKNLYEQKHAEWNKNDEVLLDETLHFIREFQQSDRCIDEGDMQNSVTCENWLKSLKDRVQLQNIAYYNPYKEVVESIAKMCKHYDNMDVGSLQDFYDNVKVKCKDAKEYDSLFPQTTWKPSDGQMNAVKDAIDYLGCTKIVRKYLMSLYEDLKKLKG